jgi:hypothetical protein
VAEAAPANFCCCRSCPLLSLRARGLCHRLRLAPFLAAKAGTPCVGVGEHYPRAVSACPGCCWVCTRSAHRGAARAAAFARYRSLPTCTPSLLARAHESKHGNAKAESSARMPPTAWAACRIQAMAIRDGLQTHYRCLYPFVVSLGMLDHSSQQKWLTRSAQCTTHNPHKHLKAQRRVHDSVAQRTQHTEQCLEPRIRGVLQGCWLRFLPHHAERIWRSRHKRFGMAPCHCARRRRRDAR